MPRHTFIGAPVTPRVRASAGADPLPLDYHIRKLLDVGATGLINLYGPPVSGKSMALAHVAALVNDPRLRLIDDVDPGAMFGDTHGRLVLFTSRNRAPRAFVAFELVPWTDDDLIEYLLHTHRNQCREVLSRMLSAPDRARLEGSPLLCATVIEQLANDQSLATVSDALRLSLRKTLDASPQFGGAPRWCLQSLIWGRENCLPQAIPPALHHRYPQLLLAAEHLGRELTEGNVDWIARRLPPDLIELTAAQLSTSPGARQALQTAARQQPRMQAAVGSLLFACDPQCRPDPKCLYLQNIHAPGAHWEELDLSGASISGANLEAANLAGATLDGVTASNTRLAHASFRLASMNRFLANSADLSHANLSGVMAQDASFASATLTGANFENASLIRGDFEAADLKYARFAGAILRLATFERAKIEGADFTRAVLTRAEFHEVNLAEAQFTEASFCRTTLRRCHLDGMEMPSADFRKANLEDSYFTGSRMPNARFRGANLRGTGLADISWENADLRKADLTGASFHLGSSRSGLVNSTLASEGTRTGFYTDDYNDQDFKPPEEIRKANLCGADLRGAMVTGTDFYLVDLRGAKLSPGHVEHFKRTGAILQRGPQ